MRQLSRGLAAAALAAMALQATCQELPVTRLSAGVHLIRAEVASTPATMAKGLMFRESLGPNEGMLFVFPETRVQCMWMRNTYIPLSVAFLDATGAIVSISDMEPRTETSHCSTGPAKYALEMTRGWFATRGIKPGAKIGGLAKPAPG